MLDQLKREVCEANRELAALGLAALTWGNVSGLSPDRSLMVIKPSGVPYAELTPEKMSVVSLQSGDAVEGLKPSSDAPTHRYVYQHFATIGGITHTHSPKATAFAQARREIPCLGTTHADHFSGSVPLTRALTEQEVREAYELNTGVVIVERFAEVDPRSMPAVLVPSHAPFCWGADAAESVANAAALEAAAAMALDALALNPGITSIDSFLLDKHHARKHGKGAYYGQR